MTTLPRASAAPGSDRLASLRRLYVMFASYAIGVGMVDAARWSPFRDTLEKPGAGPGPGIPGFDGEFCELVAEFIARRNQYLYGAWGTAFDAVESPSEIQHRCGATVVRVEFGARMFPNSDRTVWVCPRCMVVGDTPARVDLPKLSVRGDACSFSRYPVARSAGAVARVVVHRLGEQKCIPGDAVPVTAPETTLTIPGHEKWPGLRGISVVYCFDGEVLVVTDPEGASATPPAETACVSSSRAHRK